MPFNLFLEWKWKWKCATTRGFDGVLFFLSLTSLIKFCFIVIRLCMFSFQEKWQDKKRREHEQVNLRWFVSGFLVGFYVQLLIVSAVTSSWKSSYFSLWMKQNPYAHHKDLERSGTRLHLTLFFFVSTDMTWRITWQKMPDLIINNKILFFKFLFISIIIHFNCSCTTSDHSMDRKHCKETEWSYSCD